jgi:hypothetical protein
MKKCPNYTANKEKCLGDCALCQGTGRITFALWCTLNEKRERA